MSDLMRRATASFKAQVQGHKELQHTIAAEKIHKTSQKALVKAGAESAKARAKWARKEKNGTIRELMQHFFELNKSLIEAQARLTTETKALRRAFESIKAQEKRADTVGKRYKASCKAESKAQQDVQRLARRGEDLSAAETKLAAAQQQRDALAQEAGAASVDLEQHKHETIKIAMASYAKVAKDVHERGAIVARAQQELADLMPMHAPHLAGHQGATAGYSSSCDGVVAEAQAALARLPPLSPADEGSQRRPRQRRSGSSRGSNPPPAYENPSGLPPGYDSFDSSSEEESSRAMSPLSPLSPYDEASAPDVVYTTPGEPEGPVYTAPYSHA